MIKNKSVTFSIVLLSVFTALISYAFSGGITGRTLKSGTTGCDCHGGASSGVAVTITGPDIMNVNETAEYTVTISGGAAAAGGTNIAVSGGEINVIAGSGLQKIGTELTHSAPKNFSAGSVSFKFNLTAPSQPGSITLFANGNSVNLNGQNSGDFWNFASNKTVQVTPVTDADDEQIVNSFNLFQNYPNPFNPTTSIRFSIAETGSVRLILYDNLGNQIAELVNEHKPAGSYTYQFNAYDLSSGIYYYRLFSGDKVLTNKMILLK